MSAANKSQHELLQARGDDSGFEISGYRGAFPPPDVIRMFNDLTENGAERILRMVEAEQKHDHKTLERQLTIEARFRMLGQIFGFLLGAMTIGGSIWLISRGNSITGLVSLISGLALLAAAFIGTTPDGEREADTETHPQDPTPET